MFSYCTLFDSNYLTRGLAMYESLAKHSDDFHLYVFAFDDKSYHLLKMLKYENMTIISLLELEDKALLEIKPSRSAGEYCWTCTPSVIKYSMDKFNLESCTYLDADLYFFSNPAVLIEEMDDASVLITEHRYTPEYDQSKTSGVYCVQFMTFKNDKNGMKVLNWWRNACIDWCFARFEDGKFGDQKYLDDWLERFEGVHVLKNIGGGVAPWNVQQYDLLDNFELVFYHFHNYKLLKGKRVSLGAYRLDKDVIDVFYKPYTKHIQKIGQGLKEHDGENCYHGILERKAFHWKDPLAFIKRQLKASYNVFDLHELLES